MAGPRTPAHTSTENPRQVLAERIATMLLDRYPHDIQAIGAHASVAHHDDTDGSDLAITVVTRRPGTGPVPTSRRIDGIMVDLDVLSGENIRTLACTLSPDWPLRADRYVTALPLYDPDGWHDRLRNTHLEYLAETGAGEFAEFARQTWCQASVARQRAIRLAEWHDTDGAVYMLGEARLSAALTEGLLGRTYFRDAPDALHRTGFGDAGMIELARRLTEQADRLARRGCPVDGTLDEL